MPVWTFYGRISSESTAKKNLELSGQRERLLERDDDAFEAPSPLSFSKRLINEVGRLVQVVYPLLNRYVPRYRPIPPPRTAGVQLFKYALIICV